MAEIIVYTSNHCPYCVTAKNLLDRLGQTYQEINIEESDEARTEMMEKTGRRTVPQIFINGEHIGGCDDLQVLQSRGNLEDMLKG